MPPPLAVSSRRRTLQQIAAVFEWIQLVEIVIYCIFMRSVESAVALCFLMVILFLMMNKSYLRNQVGSPLLRGSLNEVLEARQIRNKVWMLYITANLGFFIFKIVYFAGGIQTTISKGIIGALELGTPLQAFLPLILLVSAIPLIYVRDLGKQLVHFNQSSNRNLLIVPTYGILGVLLIACQALNPSLSGLVMTFLMILVVGVGKWSFSDNKWRILLILIISKLFFSVSFLCGIDGLVQASSKELLQIQGFLGLACFQTQNLGDWKCIAYLAVVFSLFLVSTLMNRMFLYEQIHMTLHQSLVRKTQEQSASLRQHTDNIGQEVRGSRTIEEPVYFDGIRPTLPVIRNDSVPPRHKSLRMDQPPSRLTANPGEEELDSARKMTQVNNHAVLAERRYSKHRGTDQIPDYFTEPQNQEATQQKPEDIQPEEQAAKKSWTSVLQIWNKLAARLMDPHLLFRFMQLVSITIIQRFNTLYSLILIVWLVATTCTSRITVLRGLTIAVALPLTLLNFVPGYLYNMPFTPLHLTECGWFSCTVYGFATSNNLLSDVLILDVFMCIGLTFVKTVKNNRTRIARSKRNNPSYWQLVLALLFKYSHLVALTIMFVVGFNSVSLLNLGFAALFLIFFSRGEHVMTKSRDRGGRTVEIVTTFSHEYWIVIILYTGSTLFVKYGFFLLFYQADQEDFYQNGWLSPTGISQLDPTRVNFNFLSVCPSNTTTLFLVYLLCAAQFFVSRSEIYMRYSFSMVNTLSTKPFFRKRWMQFQQWWTFFNGVYYQSLFGVSAIICIVLSGFWSISGVFIVTILSYKLLTGFKRGKVWVWILWVNLVFILLNYLLMFLSFEYVINFIGKDATTAIAQYTIMLGFYPIHPNKLSKLFISNILIFIFSTSCSQLSQILKLPQQIQAQNQRGPASRAISQSGRMSGMTQNVEIDNSFFDSEFGKRYEELVVSQINTVFYMSLTESSKIIKLVAHVLELFITDLALIFVIVGCLYFRLSVSMLLFLILYISLYLMQFDTISKMIVESGYLRQLNLHLSQFKSKFDLLNLKSKNVLFGSDEHFQRFRSLIQTTKMKVKALRREQKLRMWPYAGFLSLVCLITTYSFKFLVAYFCQSYCTDNILIFTIERVMFVLGVSTTNQYSLFREGYFYFFMLLINSCERLVLSHSLYHDSQPHTKVNTSQSNALAQINQQNEDQEQDAKLPQDSPYQGDINSEVYSDIPIPAPQIELPATSYFEDELVQVTNMLCYFEVSKIYMITTSLVGLMSILLRFYVLLLLFSSYAKTNIFSWVYLAVAIKYWITPMNLSSVSTLNKLSACILVLQYILLLLNLGPDTAPYYVQEFGNLSLIQKILHNQDWLSYLAFGGSNPNQFWPQNQNISFAVNSVIIFATEYYITLFDLVTRVTLHQFQALKRLYFYTKSCVEGLSNNQKMHVNFQRYKSRAYVVLRQFFELMTVRYHLVLGLIILIIVIDLSSIFSILLFAMAVFYFYLVLFSPKSTDHTVVEQYSKVYFNIYKAIIFTELLILIIFHLPPLITQCRSELRVIQVTCNQIRELSIVGQLFILFFLQLWSDLDSSSEYGRFKTLFYKGQAFKERVMSKCYAHRQNNTYFRSLYKQYEEVLNFDEEVAKGIESVEKWHQLMNHQKEGEQLVIATPQEKPKVLAARESLQQPLKMQHHILEQGKQHDANLAEKFKGFLKNCTNHTLYQSLPFLMLELHYYHPRVMGVFQVHLFDYVIENFSEDEIRLDQLDSYYKDLFTRIQNEPSSFLNIVESERQLLAEPPPSEIRVSPLLDIKHTKHDPDLLKLLAYSFLGNFQFILEIFIVAYYFVNPCLASLPLIAFCFGYELITRRKMKVVAIFYTIFLMFGIEIMYQIIYVNSKQIPSWFTWLFFVPDGPIADVSTSLSNDYLQFLFVLFIINELVTRFVGMHGKTTFDIENPHQCFVRFQLNDSIMQPSLDEDLDDKLSRSLHKDKEQESQKKIQMEPEKPDQDTSPYVLYQREITDPQQYIYSLRPIQKGSTLGFINNFYFQKAGLDLYPFIASLQILITIYLIIFYQSMINSNSSQSLTNVTSKQYFSAPMILTIITYVVIIVIERRITLMKYQRGKKQLIKYVFTMVVLFLICCFSYVIAPYNQTVARYAYNPTPALQGFMFLQFIYFWLSAWQIRAGYKRYKRLNSMLHQRNLFNNIVVSVFTAVPFLQQLKILMDWSFSKTSLTLDNWTIHFNIYLVCFQAKINSIFAKGTPLGSTQPNYIKILMGWLGFIGILFLIFGPMILFSGLNPVSKPNPVTGGQLQIGIQIVDGNYFELFSTAHLTGPPVSITPQMFQALNFSQVPALAALKPNELEEVFQMVNYSYYSDNKWDISAPNYNNLAESINQTLNEMQAGLEPTNTYQMIIKYQLNRNITETVPTPTDFSYPLPQSGSSILNYQQLLSINNTLSFCGRPTFFPQFYISLISLDTVGNAFKPRPIPYGGKGPNPYLYNISLELMCDSTTNLTRDSDKLYWQATRNNRTEGVVMYVLSDKYQTLSFGFTFFGLYTSIILVVAGFIRGFFTGQISMIPYTQNPRPDSLLAICEAISVVRMRKNYRAEMLMYYQLLDIMRSPQVMKYVCGNYTSMLKEEEKKTKKEKEKEKSE